MSYQVLARKWRPYQFNNVVGQSHVLTALSNALDHNRLHHAYLFSGTRGVGKTSIARIFAKGLNCEQGVSATPCGQCTSCVEIEQGRSVDLLEIDAASRTKVEDTRELLDNVQYKPARSRYKIYLIDEVHMLSRHSFNALLKTLEEPPEYVKFILATTDPQKLPVTILSRCLQFHLKHLQPEQIQQQLTDILAKEQINAEPAALTLLAHAAEGSMRDALSLADQAIALGAGEIKHAQVSEMLGSISTDHALSLVEHLVQPNVQRLFGLVADFAAVGMEWDNLLKEVSEQLHRVALAQMLVESVDSHAPDAERILALATALLPQTVQLYYQIVLQGRQDLPYAASAKSGFEMTLLRLLAFKPANIAPLPISTLGQQPMTGEHGASNASNATSSRGGVAPVNMSSPPPSEAPAVIAEHNSSAAAVAPPAMPPVAAEVAQPLQAAPASTATPASPLQSLVAARAMLKNQLKQAKNAEAVEQAPQPAPAAPKQSLFNRIADQVPRFQVGVEPAGAQVAEAESYRWQARNPIQAEAVPEITPKQIKAVMGHERTKPMREKLEQEAQQQDDWCRLVDSMQVSQLSRQLALNAAMAKQDAQVTLWLRQEQAHLHTQKHHAELSKALSNMLNEAIELQVLVDDEHGITPLEWRDKLYAEKLQQAVKSLQQDSNIQFIRERFAATLNEDSIRPI